MREQPFDFFVQTKFDDWRVEYSHHTKNPWFIAPNGLHFQTKESAGALNFYLLDKNKTIDHPTDTLVTHRSKIGTIVTHAQSPKGIIRALQKAFSPSAQQHMNHFHLAVGAIMKMHDPTAEMGMMFSYKNFAYIGFGTHRIPLDPRETHRARHRLKGIAHCCLLTGHFHTDDALPDSPCLQTSHQHLLGLRIAEEMFPISLAQQKHSSATP